MTRVNYRVSCFVFGLFIAVLTGCGGDDGPTGATASLSWDPIMDSDFLHYTVHYGKQSSGDGGSCNYEHSVDVVEPVALVTGLEFNTRITSPLAPLMSKVVANAPTKHSS